MNICGVRGRPALIGGILLGMVLGGAGSVPAQNPNEGLPDYLDSPIPGSRGRVTPQEMRRAVSRLKEGLQKNPDDPAALYWMGFFKGTEGDYRAMNEHWERCFFLSDQYRARIDAQREVFSRKVFGEAMVALNRGARLPESDPERRRFLTGARELLKRALLIKPDDSNAREALDRVQAILREEPADDRPSAQPQ